MIYPTESKNFYMARSGVATNGTGSTSSSAFPDRDDVVTQALIDRPCVLKYFSMSFQCDEANYRYNGVRIELCDGTTPIIQVMQYPFHAAQAAQTWSVMIPGNGIRISSSLRLAFSQKADNLDNLKASGISIWYQG